MNYNIFSFTQVGLVLDTADLAGSVIHKWVPIAWNILYLKILNTNSPARCRRPAARVGPLRPRHGIWLQALRDHKQLILLRLTQN